MKKMFVCLLIAILSIHWTDGPGPGYVVGDVVKDFDAKSTTGTTVGIGTFPTAKGFVIVFTCNTCPYAQMYEDRINALAQKLDDASWPLIAINSNDKSMSPGDAYDKMQERAKSKAYSFPYIYDESQSIVRAFGAAKTPHFYVLDGSKKVRYIGALDDNAEDGSAVTRRYVEDAIQAIEKNVEPNPTFTRAIGCGIKKRPS